MLGRITAWGLNNMVCAQVEKPSFYFEGEDYCRSLGPTGGKIYRHVARPQRGIML